MIKHLLYIFFTINLLFSCDFNTSFIAESSDKPKIVAYSIINAIDTPIVYVGISSSVNDKQNIENEIFSVNLFDETSKIDFTKIGMDSNFVVYKANTNITNNHSYYLNVSNTKYGTIYCNSILLDTSKQKPLINITKIKLASSSENVSFYSIHLKDSLASEKNFVLEILEKDGNSYKKISKMTICSEMPIAIKIPIIEDTAIFYNTMINNSLYNTSNVFFTNSQTTKKYIDFNTLIKTNSNSLKIRLSTASDSYYNFTESVYYTIKNEVDNKIAAFFGNEIAPVKSNIIGGYGVFGTEAFSEQIFDLSNITEKTYTIK